MQSPTTFGIDCPAPALPAGAQGVARVAVVDGAARLIVTFERVITDAERPALLDPKGYSLTGGRRLFPRVVSAAAFDPPDGPPDLKGRRVALGLDGEGDYSVYTLTVNAPDVDPFFASAPLRFRLGCDHPFDCQPAPAAPAAEADANVLIDYLAKDYAGFRQALLDFIPTRLPEWVEWSEADLGMVILELFAATADTLSYTQDRIANEAFLDTASQRRSVAGHLGLLGYELDPGSSAYTWLQFQVNATHSLTSNPGLRVTNRPRRDDETVLVFETHGTATLRVEHNRMSAYAGGNPKCCLPAGALSVPLAGNFPDLRAGDYLLLDDGKGQRDVVRLVSRPELRTVGTATAAVTIARWSPATPLRHDYCVNDLIVRGNLVLATHGETITGEVLRPASPATTGGVGVTAPDVVTRPPRLRLPLSQSPLAYLDASVLELVQGEPAAAPVPVGLGGSVGTLTIQVNGPAATWTEQATLMRGRPDSPIFRVEVEDDGSAAVVFGDGTFGLRPPDGAQVTATYRVGGGSVGNVAGDTLVLPRPRAGESVAWLVSVTNPLPAAGGRNPETADHARRFGPATLGPLLAVTADDYQAAAQGYTDAARRSAVQRASASFQWSGSWLSVSMAVDPVGAESLSGDLRSGLLSYLGTRRLVGYDLDVIPPRYVAIDLVIGVCLAPGARSGDVEPALLQVLGTSARPGGGLGFFHPDRFTFGDPLPVGQVLAAAQGVPGVASVQIARLARLRSGRPDLDTAINLRQGFLAVGPDEIVRLDNDPNFPENGTLRVNVVGVVA